jgi:NAD(P)-dependent dehydrogenase (short-subunit alcohol dehydrogenase family)
MTAGVLVAGSNGGIGAAIVETLRQRGVPVFAVDRDVVDITQPGGAEHAVSKAIDELGELSGVVHAIGMSGRPLGDGSIMECTDQAWDEVHRVNLGSVFRLIRASMPHLVGRKSGSIVVIGSGLAATLDNDFLTVAYASAKGALIPMIRSAAFTGAPHGVRVNLVSPGVVDTPMARRAVNSPEISARLVELQPLAAGPQSAIAIAKTASWLLSDDAESITGANLPADGGWTLR